MTRELRLVLGDQLNHQHSWFQTVSSEVTYVLMEVRSETDYCQHHIQKVCAFFAAMRAFAAQRQREGHQVIYLTLDDPANTQSLTGNLQRLMGSGDFQCWAWQQPDERRVDSALAAFADAGPWPYRCVDSEHFLSPRDSLAQVFKPDTHHFLMETFYRHMRRQHDVLMTRDGKPVSGRWNHDHDNRAAYDGAQAFPRWPTFRNEVGHIAQLLAQQSVATIGSLPADGCIDWPVTRAQALSLLDAFVAQALPWFGRYQDALVDGEGVLFHSRLSLALNLKLLHPMEVIRRAEAAYLQGQADIAAVEGFIRQILGWREYMRGIYWRLHAQWHDSNPLAHQRALPAWFWTGNTRMRCLAQAIRQSLQTSYAHHIQRLMVTGNFALLAGVDPAEVNHWYLGIYVDALEWVQWPNTHGMSQYADGGRIATKPYVSSGAYLHKQGDHCRQCHYHVRDKTGERACPFNTLYWHFIDRHQARFAGNPRMAVIVRGWQKRSLADRQRVLADAERRLIEIETL